MNPDSYIIRKIRRAIAPAMIRLCRWAERRSVGYPASEGFADEALCWQYALDNDGAYTDMRPR